MPLGEAASGGHISEGVIGVPLPAVVSGGGNLLSHNLTYSKDFLFVVPILKN